MIPIIVENTLATLEEVGQALRDYKIVGNERGGVTIILRYQAVDMINPLEHDRCVPLLGHKSPVRIARDRIKMDTWWQANVNTGEHYVEPQAETAQEKTFRDMETMTDLDNMKQREIHTQAIQTDSVICEMHNVSVQCDPVDVKVQCGGSHGSGGNDIKSTSVETQVQVETTTRGVCCQQRPDTRHHRVQTDKLKTRSLGLSAVSPQNVQGTQTLTSFTSKGVDVAVFCPQSPGAISRQIQTYVPKLVERGTKPHMIKTQSVAVSTCDLNVEKDPDDLSAMALVPGCPLLSSSVHEASGPHFELETYTFHKKEHMEDSGITMNETVGTYQDSTSACSSHPPLGHHKELVELLSQLGVSSTMRNDYAATIRKEGHNLKVKHIVEQKFTNEDDIVEYKYLCIFDDVIVPVFKNPLLQNPDHHNHSDITYLTGRYTKLYDQYWEFVSTSTCSYRVLENPSDSFELYGQVAMQEIADTMSDIKLFHRIW
jgi:hypothetical protein